MRDYMRAENKLQSISQVIIPRVSLPQATTQIISAISEREPRKRIRHALEPTQEKLGRGFGENAGGWTGPVEISEEEILAVGVACMAIYGPAPGLKGRTFEL